jgi:transposase
METIIRRCPGLDVHKASVVACVRLIDENGELQSFTQSFGTAAHDLLMLGDWLSSYAVTIVGMEATGVYWKPVYTLLETDFECWLLNAQHLQNVPGPQDRRSRRGLDRPAGRARLGAPELRTTARDS